VGITIESTKIPAVIAAQQINVITFSLHTVWKLFNSRHLHLEFKIRKVKWKCRRNATRLDDIHPRINLQSSKAPPTSCEDEDAFNTLANAYYGLEKLCEERLSELSSKYEAKLNVSTTLQALSARLTSDVEEMKVEIKSLRQWIPSLVTNLEYYKKKHTDLEAQMSDLQPLWHAIINSVNGLLSTKQWYKVMKNNNIANAIAQAVLNNILSLESDLTPLFQKKRSGSGKMSLPLNWL
jgi:predicted  nucleic acid-binding Zn-ribbon protein